MDPGFQLALRAAFALLLSTAALHKLRDVPRFAETLLAYEIVPPRLAGAAAGLVPLLEMTIAALLLSASHVAVAGASIAALMLLYAGAIEWNVSRGRTDIDCGCMGPATRVPLGRSLVVRNLLLAATALLLLVPESPRALTLLDLAAVTASTMAMTACWLAAERMLALAPRAAAMRSTRPGSRAS